MIRPRTVILGALLGLGLFGAASYAHAGASDEPNRLPRCAPCTTVVKTDATGILTTSNGEPVTPANQPSTAVVVVGNGVEVTLPDGLAKAGYTVPLATPVLLSAIARLEYQTWQLNPASVALPSLNLTLDYNGADPGGFATLVYEPAEDGQTIHLNQWDTWNALRNGHAKWWSTRSLALLPGGDLGPGFVHTPAFAWSDILTKYPSAVMLAWGLNFGKGSAGAHARWGKVTIGTIDWCVTTKWQATSPPPSTTPSGAPSGTPSAVPTTPSAPPTTVNPDPTTPGPQPTDTAPNPTSVAGFPGGNGGIGTGRLPTTGYDTSGLVWIGAALVLGGALLGVVAWRRRRVRFTA